MTVKNLIEKCNVKKVCEFWDREYKHKYEYDIYPSDHIPEFLEFLKTIEPEKNEFSMIVEKYIPQYDFEGDEPYVDVHGVKVDGDEHWGLDFSTNAEWVGFEIDNRLECTDEELLTHILWEMSFYGWFDEQRKEILDDITKRKDEVDKWIEEGTLDEHTFTMEEVKKRLEKRIEEGGKKK